MKIGDTYKAKGLPYELVCVKADETYYDYFIKEFVGFKYTDEEIAELDTLIEKFLKDSKAYDKYVEDIIKEVGEDYFEYNNDVLINQVHCSYSVLKPIDKNIEHTYLVIKREIDNVESPDDHYLDWCYVWHKGSDTAEALDTVFECFKDKDKDNPLDCWGDEFVDYMSKSNDKKLTICIESSDYQDNEVTICEGETIVTPDDYGNLYEDRELSLVSDHPQDLTEFFIVPKNDNKSYYLLREYDYKDTTRWER